jgi:hypothetical protein
MVGSTWGPRSGASEAERWPPSGAAGEDGLALALAAPTSRSATRRAAVTEIPKSEVILRIAYSFVDVLAAERDHNRVAKVN